jgi:RNA polymerase sigma factor (sigma-70 family)
VAPQHSETEAPAEQANAGDAYVGWEDVYENNVGWVYRLLCARVGNKMDAEDLTSEVFLAALRPLRITASRREVRAYLKVTARTVLAQHWRQHFKVEITHRSDAATVPHLDDGPDPRVARRARAILDAVSERHRTILQLRFVQGMPVKDAAQAMGISIGNAKVLQHRALTAAAHAGMSEISAPA